MPTTPPTPVKPPALPPSPAPPPGSVQPPVPPFEQKLIEVLTRIAAALEAGNAITTQVAQAQIFDAKHKG